MRRTVHGWTAGLLLASACAGASAHGGLSMDQDKCKLTVGRFLMHFAGYQEDAQRSEFCEDIPHKGKTIIVLDFVDDALRDMPVEVSIVRRTGGNTPYEQMPVVYRLEPKLYPRGTLTLTHDFAEDGDYVGLVYAGNNRQNQSVFPFAVGRNDAPKWLSAIIAAALALGVLGYAVARRTLKRDLVAGRADASDASRAT